MITAPCIKSNVAIRTYAPKKKSNTTQFPYPAFISHAPVINAEYWVALNLFQAADCIPVPECKIYPVIREYLIEVLSVRKRDLLRIDQKCPWRVEAESPDIVIHNIIIEAIVMPGIYGVKLIDLNKMQSQQGRFLFN